MKKYISTMQVVAEPMTMGEAYEKNLLRAGRVPNESEKTKAGYHVKYDDYHEGWSPAELFEKAYRVTDTPLDRIIEENELSDRLERLYAFICSDTFKELDSTTRAMLAVQYSSMTAYYHILCLLSTKMENENKDGGCTGISFGSAIALLKSGFAIRRSGWNGKNLFVIKQVPAHIESDIIPNMQSLPQSAKDLILGGKGYIKYTNQCLIYNGNTGQADSWVPSISDVFADDWELVE